MGYRDSINGLSPLATHEGQLKDVTPDRTSAVWGVCVHTTGSTIVEKALKLGVDPLEYAVAYYLDPRAYSAHYVVDHDGDIVQISDEHERAAHVGLEAEWRLLYLSGQWRNLLPKEVVAQWDRRWPGYHSPSHLYPGASPNNVYVGIELLPLTRGIALPPMRPGLTFTAMQHDAVRKLILDIGTRWSLLSGLTNASRLVGHEDLTPHSRHDKGGGWDPGAMRAAPRFDWEYVLRSASLGTGLF